MRPKVVICGSFHRAPEKLQRLFRELEATGCRILSPISTNFVDTSASVVRTSHETEFSIDELERFHLRTIQAADFVWLHAPEGHIGISSAYELGFANAIKKPVFSFIIPIDEMLATRVNVVASVFSALEFISLGL